MLKTLSHLFTPQRSNNHRPRILHPAGMVVFVAALLIFNSAIELTKLMPERASGLVLGYASNISISQILTLTNIEREAVSLPPLELNAKLNTAAQAKARHMFDNGYWAHISPDGTTPWNFIRNTGYTYRVAGENLARDFDDTPTMVQAWMDSPTHRANVIHPKYTETGIAVVNGKLNGYETTLVVHMFGLPAIPTTIPIEEANPSIPETSAESLEPSSLVDTNPSVLSGTEVTPTYLDQPALNSYQKTYLSPLNVKRSMVVSILGLIFAVLIIDEIIIHHKQTVRFVGKNFAHISFLALVLFIILNVIEPGGIL